MVTVWQGKSWKVLVVPSFNLSKPVGTSLTDIMGQIVQGWCMLPWFIQKKDNSSWFHHYQFCSSQHLLSDWFSHAFASHSELLHVIKEQRRQPLMSITSTREPPNITMIMQLNNQWIMNNHRIIMVIHFSCPFHFSFLSPLPLSSLQTLPSKQFSTLGFVCFLLFCHAGNLHFNFHCKQVRSILSHKSNWYILAWIWVIWNQLFFKENGLCMVHTAHPCCIFYGLFSPN